MSQPWAVITGASSGLGVGFARRLAGLGVGVVLAARSADKLDQVAADIRRDFGVQARVSPVDLTDRASRAGFIDGLAGLDVAYLVNNAGFGTISPFVEIEPDRLSREMELNMVALTELTRASAPGMVDRGRGAIINVASNAAFQPIPTMAVYAATKAYVLRFTIALWEELKPTGVRALAICPGPTETEFFSAAGNDDALRNRRTVDQVVRTTFDALAKHRPFVVDGPQNRLQAFATRFAPASVQAALAKYVVTQ